MLTHEIYYRLKPFIPRRLQIKVRRQIIQRKKAKYSHVWPIDEKAGKKPEGWTGWPEGKQFALVLMHDVDTAEGHSQCHELIALEEEKGFRSSFNIVPERYKVSSDLRDYLVKKGFEVGVHGLKHDGKLFRSREAFKKQAIRINQHMKEWQSIGFVSPSMHHNLNWIHDLDLVYDTSTFDIDPFEPQPDGVSTIFPFWVQNGSTSKGYIELPYTLPQDFTLFIIMKEKSIDIWKKKLDWIAEKGGMALLITHPDYMSFDGKKRTIEKYPVEYYKEFLEYIKLKYGGRLWAALPKEMARYWIDKCTYSVTEQTKEGIRIMPESQHQIGLSPQFSRKKIWVDLDNSPHVPFFRPIITELNNRGHEVFVTVRDCSQTCGLADLFKIKYRKIGRHYGKSIGFKVAGTVLRALQLSSVLQKYKPDIAVSHGSRAQMLSSQMLNVPTLVFMDYEHVKGFIRPFWIMVPEIISDGDLGYDKTRILRYPGIKEDVYIPAFRPDPKIRKKLGVGEDALLVTIRPPATEAHYHNPKSEKLLSATVNFLGNQSNVKMVILPRNDKQKLLIMNEWPEWCWNGKIVMPEYVVDGLNLLWHSDLAVSGGGTMNREAAALGVPVYSIFRGKIGAVDRYLSEKGRLTLLEDKAEIPQKILLVKRHLELMKDRSNRTLDTIVSHILKLIEAS